MKIFEQYFKNRLSDSKFKAFFDQECHICECTIGIFAELFANNLSLKEIALNLNIHLKDLENLETGEYCDPHLVIKLCEHLGRPHPNQCNRLMKTDAHHHLEK